MCFRSDVENAEEVRHRRHGEADRPRSPDLAAEDSGRRKPALVRWVSRHQKQPCLFSTLARPQWSSPVRVTVSSQCTEA